MSILGSAYRWHKALTWHNKERKRICNIVPAGMSTGAFLERQTPTQTNQQVNENSSKLYVKSCKNWMWSNSKYYTQRKARLVLAWMTGEGYMEVAGWELSLPRWIQREAFFPVSSHSSERQPFLIIVNKKLDLKGLLIKEGLTLHF